MAMEPTTMAMMAGLGTSVLGAGLDYKARNDAIKARQKEARKAAYNQLMLQDEANQFVEDTAQQYDQPTREANEAAEAEAYTNYLMEKVAGSKADSEMGLNAPISGKVSNDYLMRRADAEAANLERTSRFAQLLGKIAGPTKLREDEAVGLGDLASNLAMSRNFSAGQYGADQLAIDAAGQANPGLIAAGAVLRGAAPAVGQWAGNRYGTPPTPRLPVSTTGGYPTATHAGFTYNLPNIKPLR